MYVRLDLMCWETDDVNLIMSFFFLGWGLGVFTILMPDQFGRKNLMKVVLPLQIFAAYLTCFGESTAVVKTGFFLQGLLHTRITVCNMHSIELVEDQHKPFMSTCINVFDSSMIMVCCVVVKNFCKDMDKVLQVWWLIGSIACVLYLALVPESPRWLFMQKSNNKEGIESMNYVAWANGSEFRVPDNA